VAFAPHGALGTHFTPKLQPGLTIME